MLKRLALSAAVTLVAACNTAAPAVGSAGGTETGDCSAEVVKLRQALASIADADLPRITLNGLSEACPMGDFGKGLAAIAGAGDADAAVLAAAVLDENRKVAATTCADFESVFPTLANADPASRAGLFFDACKLDALGVFTSAEFNSAFTAHGTTFIAPAVYGWLATHGMRADDARIYARAVAGLR